MNRADIKKELQEILESGTPKEKARLVCRRVRVLSQMDKAPIVTPEEVQAIKDTITTQEEQEEYNKWIAIHSVYTKLAPTFGLVLNSYEAELHIMIGYLNILEAYRQEQDHLNIIYQGLLDAGDEQAIATFRDKVKRLSFINEYAEVELTDTEVRINVDNLYKVIKSREEGLRCSYELAKALVIETENFKKRTSSADFVLEAIEVGIKTIKRNPYIDDLPAYDRRRLQDRIDKGQKVVAEDRKRAVLPYYEEIEPSKTERTYFKNMINNYLKNYGK